MALRPSEMREEPSNPNPKGIVKSKFRKEHVLPKCQTSCTKLSGIPEIKLKVKFRYQRRTLDSFSCFSNNHYGFFDHQAKGTQKVRKSVNDIKMYFKQFFTFLERTFTFRISLFRATYRSSSPDAFTKKGVLLQVRSIFTEEYPCGTFAWMFSCKLSKYSQDTFLEKHLWMTASVYMKVNTACAYRHSPVQS